MRVACKANFEDAYPGVTGINDVDCNLNDLKVFFARNELKKKNQLSPEVKSNLENALQSKNFKRFSALHEDNVKDTLLNLIEKPNITSRFCGLLDDKTLVSYLNEEFLYERELDEFNSSMFLSKYNSSKFYERLKKMYEHLESLRVSKFQNIKSRLGLPSGTSKYNSTFLTAHES
jgi:hypothetical protein